MLASSYIRSGAPRENQIYAKWPNFLMALAGSSLPLCVSK